MNKNIDSLDELLIEIHYFKLENKCQEEDMVIIFNESHRPNDYPLKEKNKLFGVDIQFSNMIQDIVITKKYTSHKFTWPSWPENLGDS